MGAPFGGVLFKRDVMKEQTLFNQIPGYPCCYSLKSREGMVYEYRMSESAVIRITMRDWGSWRQRTFTIVKGNTIMVDHCRSLWGDTMRLMDLVEFVEEVNLTMAEFDVLLQLSNDFV